MQSGTSPRRTKSDSGAAAVEFALIMPILLLLVFGIIQYGFYFWSMQGGSNAVRDAARAAAVGAPVACDEFTDLVETNVDSMSQGNVSITRTFDSAGPTVEVGDQVTVEVAFDSVDLGIPFIPMPEDGRVIQRAATRVEYVPDDTIGDCS